MHRWVLLAVALVAMTGCQIPGAVGRQPHTGDEALARLAGALPGDYDNHEQVAHAAAADKAQTAIAPLRVQHAVRTAETGRDGASWLWRLSVAGKAATSAVWLMRAQAEADGRHVRVVPFRPVDSAVAQAQFADTAKAFVYEPAQWAGLEPCAQSGEWGKDTFSASANVDACSALLPGLGQDAALLPLRFSVDAEMLRVVTFADTSRGADASEQARRVRWFDGWAAINGGGPQARSDNQDWHMQRDLHLSSEGGRAVLRWRDGAPSGYTLEMERTSYPERKLSVLQLNVIEDASGRTVTYTWADPASTAIGFNLGWLQLGFVQQPALRNAHP